MSDNLMSEPTIESLKAEIDFLDKQLADTMRENEQMKERLRTLDDENEARGNLLRNSGIRITYAKSEGTPASGGGGGSSQGEHPYKDSNG